MKKFLFISFFLISAQLFSQTESKIDSLENRLNTVLSDTEKVHLLNKLAVYFSRNEHKKATENAHKALSLSTKISYPQGIITSHFNLGMIYQYEGSYLKALEEYLTALKIAEPLNNDSLILKIYNSLANNFALQERRKEALEYYEKAFAIAKKKGYKTIQGTLLGNMGNIYYYNSYDFAKDKWDTAGLEKALEHYAISIKINAEENDSNGIVSPMLNTALAQIELGKVDEALQILAKVKDICLRKDNLSDLAFAVSNTGRANYKMKNYSAALENYHESIRICRSLNDRNTIMDAYVNISEMYAEQKDYKNAYEYYARFSELRDSILNDENSRSVSEMQTKYETDKKEKQIEMQELELNKKQVLIYAASFGFVLMFSLAFVIFRGYKHKQKANEEISKQKEIIEEKNKNITDSILYANRIQTAILPEQNLFQSIFPDSFIFYRPRDIISGDFYWFSEKEEHILLAVADCTGHGVPGAMMSMVGTSLLHQIVNEKTINNPSEVLAELDKQIIRSLKQKGEEGESREGMDISFIDINKKNNLLRYSGANRPFYILKNEELRMIEASKYPIGSISRKTKIFDLHEIQLQKDDCVYLTTDGISDQFGGKTNKKFMTRRFKESLISIHHLSMQKQKEELIKIIDEWKGNYEQVDDICVIGIRV